MQSDCVNLLYAMLCLLCCELACEIDAGLLADADRITLHEYLLHAADCVQSET